MSRSLAAKATAVGGPAGRAILNTVLSFWVLASISLMPSPDAASAIVLPAGQSDMTESYLESKEPDTPFHFSARVPTSHDRRALWGVFPARNTVLPSGETAMDATPSGIAMAAFSVSPRSFQRRSLPSRPALTYPPCGRK